MAQRDFWRGFCAAIAIFGTIAISCIFNVYLGGLISMIIALVLLINLLVSIRGYLQQKHQLEKVKDIAKALYPDHGHLAVRFLELRQHVGLNFVEVSWFAFLEPKGAKGLKRLLLQTRELALTKDKALNELQTKLVKDLVKKMTNSPTAGAAIEAAI